MNRSKLLVVVTATAFLGAAGCVEDHEGLQLYAGEESGEKVALSGAIFTTTEDGATVDGNIYEEFCDVYLNGGPMHEGAAGLPEGDYYFQVTSPSGAPTDPPAALLSNDDIERRQFHVDETGRISGLSGEGSHGTGENVVDGGVTVQLCPFLPTPNPGCEFKLWVTPVEDYDPTAAGAAFGFLHSRSKTDNFKVCEPLPPPPPPPPPDCEDEECDVEEQ